MKENTTKQTKKSPKLKRSKFEIQAFLKVDDNAVKNATSFKQFYEQDENQFIE